MGNDVGFRQIPLRSVQDQFFTLFQSGALLGLLMLTGIPLFAASQESISVDPWQVEAAFLRNFTHYVTWPDFAFSDDRSPWRICILGKDPFGEVLEKTLKGRTEKGRRFSIHRSRNPAELRQCQIIYMAYKISMSRRSALAEIKDLPVLTVSNEAGFLEEGGMIRFDVTDHVEMSINLDHAHAASLLIQTKMLEVSRSVIVNGKVRKTR
jgi:hypothetical protein